MKRVPKKKKPAGGLIPSLQCLLVRGVEQSPDGIAIADQEENLTFVNTAFASCHGYTPGELIGRNLSILHTPEQMSAVKRANRVLRETGEFRGEVWHARKDGGVFLTMMHNTLIRDEAGKPTGLMAVIRDITERKAMEGEMLRHSRHLEKLVRKRTASLKKINTELRGTVKEQKLTLRALAEAEHKWRSLWENIPDIVLTVNREGGILTINRPVPGAPEAGPPGKSIYDFLAPGFAEKGKKMLRRVFRTGKPAVYEVSAEGPKGPATGWYLAQMVPMKYGGRVTAVILICTDLTRSREADQKLKASAAKLREQKKALEQKNVALRELLVQLELEKQQIRDDVASNVEKLLSPVMREMKKAAVPANRKYLEILEQNIEELASPLGRKLSDQRLKLSPREIEICNMIKSGLTNKEIAQSLRLSRATVEKHRENIRAKFGISGKKINLRSFLQSL